MTSYHSYRNYRDIWEGNGRDANKNVASYQNQYLQSWSVTNAILLLKKLYKV